MNSERLRRNAEHCLGLAAKTTDETARMRFLRAANAWKEMARSKDRLDAALMSDKLVYEGSVEKVA
jgi:hypothetical protein